jgi:proton-dependent oligopeptide transporter, POT family
LTHLSHDTRLVVFVELCERFSFYGCKGVWGNYVKNRADDPHTPGMLGMGPKGVMGLMKFFVFWAYTTPVGGAILADQYFGRYTVIIWGCVLYIIGEIILTLTSLPLSSISRTAHIGGFIASIVIIGLGTGGMSTL